MTLVILESPFAGRGPWPLSALRRLLNVRYARACVRDSLARGEAPIASHLLYPQVYRDGVPEEQERGMEAGLAWSGSADLAAVYRDRGISAGMKRAIKHHLDRGTRVVYRSLWP